MSRTSTDDQQLFNFLTRQLNRGCTSFWGWNRTSATTKREELRRRLNLPYNAQRAQ